MHSSIVCVCVCVCDIPLPLPPSSSSSDDEALRLIRTDTSNLQKKGRQWRETQTGGGTHVPHAIMCYDPHHSPPTRC